jgi:hypothetical protein
MDLNRKLCHKCNKEFGESDNFNWSCCTHRSEWGGTMWWCCGQTSKDAKGCKFEKHYYIKEENEEDEEDTG